MTISVWVALFLVLAMCFSSAAGFALSSINDWDPDFFFIGGGSLVMALHFVIKMIEFQQTGG